MRRRIVVLLTVGVLAGGYVGIAQASPGPNGHNDHGLCTAYFNGQKNGHDEHGSPGPFAALEEQNDNDLQAIYEFCQTAGIDGNPDENGRFTDCFTDTNDDPSDDCSDG